MKMVVFCLESEELLEIFMCLVWVAHGLHDADWTPSQAHIETINIIAPAFTPSSAC